MRKYLPIIIIVCVLLTMVGCSSTNEDLMLYFELSSTPDTIDPQKAQTNSELMVASNLFEGLMRLDNNGKICCGCAENYTKNGNTYTFTLRNNLCWDDDTPLTADDVIFGLKRAISSDTACPFAQRFFIIKNAESYYNGSCDFEKVGINELNENCISITVKDDGCDLLSALATPAAAPCNEAFFNSCKGSYGRKKESILCNGSYYLAKWNTTTFGIRIKRNAQYIGEFTSKNGGVFFSCTDDAYTQLQKNYVDMAYLSGSDAKSALNEGYSYIQGENVAYIVRIGENIPKALRHALYCAYTTESYKDGLSLGYREADSFFPKLTGKTDIKFSFDYNEQTALNYYKSAGDLYPDGMPVIKIYYYGSAEIKSAVTDLAARWQKVLSATVNIEYSKYELSSSYYEKSAVNIYPIEYYGLEWEYLTAIEDKSASDFTSLTQKLSSDYIYMPFLFESKLMYYTESVSAPAFNTCDCTVDFAFIEKH